MSQQHKDQSDMLRILNNDSRIRNVRRASVIGSKTSTAATCHELLAVADPTVVLLEEAGDSSAAYVLVN
jgi:hypothetical protein